jgi:hypothetical protein
VPWLQAADAAARKAICVRSVSDRQALRGSRSGRRCAPVSNPHIRNGDSQYRRRHVVHRAHARRPLAEGAFARHHTLVGDRVAPTLEKLFAGVPLSYKTGTSPTGTANSCNVRFTGVAA